MTSMSETGALQRCGDVLHDSTESAPQMNGRDKTVESNGEPSERLLRKMIVKGGVKPDQWGGVKVDQ